MKITALQNIMVSIGLKTASAGDLLNAGFTRIFRTKAEQAALTALYAEKAASSTPSLDVNRLHRTDGAGNLQADGGYLIFTAEGQKTVTPQNLVADLTKFGFHLSVVELFQAEGNEEHLKLRVTWSRNGQAFTTLNAVQAGLLRRYFDLAYWKLFGFFNPEAVSLEGNESPIKGSIVTLNFSGVIQAAQTQGRDDIREVRMTDADGHLACPLRTPAKPAGQTPIPEWHPGDGTTKEVVNAAFAHARCPDRPSRSFKGA